MAELARLRDRALLAVNGFQLRPRLGRRRMNAEDCYRQGKRWWIKLHEKGGKHHEVPVHHKAEE